VTALGIVLAVVAALAILAVVAAVLGLRYVIDLPVGPARRQGRPAPGLDVKEIGRALDEAVRMSSGSMPVGVQARVTEIRREVLELLPSTGAFPLGSEDLYVIQRTATDYLPSTLQAYLAVRQGDPGRPASAGDKTPLQLLEEQLQLLDDRLDEISEAVRQQDLDQLVANGRFLEERFGRDTDGLALPPKD
jgi:hypothetical protein